MGYRTYFNMSIMRENCAKFTEELVDQIMTALKEKQLLGWIFVPKPWLTDTKDTLSLEPEDECRWDSYDQDMQEISKRFPDCVFCLHGEGEYRDDTWDAYYHNGDSEDCYVNYTIPDPQLIHWPGNQQKIKPERTTLYNMLERHAGHDVSIVSYGDGLNISLECNDCGCVIFDTDIYDLIGKE